MITRMMQGLVVLGILGFWAHSLYEVVRLEQAATPKDIRMGRGTYEPMLARALERDPVQYYGIYQGRKRVGHSLTESKRLDRSRFLVRHELSFSPDIGLSIPIRADSEIKIGPDFLIEHFTSKVLLGGEVMQLRFEGEAVIPDRPLDSFGDPVSSSEALPAGELVITSHLPGGGTHTTRVARELTLFNGFSPFVGAPELKVGEEWYIQGVDLSMLGGGWDPKALRPKILTAKVTRQEMLEWEGEPVEVFVAEIPEELNDRMRRRAEAWIAKDGRILRETHRVLDWTFTFERETPRKPGKGWKRAR